MTARRLALHDQALVYVEYDRDQYRGGDERTGRELDRHDRPSLVSQQNANYPQPIGTVRAYAMSGGRVGIIVDGSTSNTDLTINPLGDPRRRASPIVSPMASPAGTTCSTSARSRSTTARSGPSKDSRTAELSGPLQVSGTTAIDRIAFDAILPGASITTGGDVETLDVLNGIDLSGAGPASRSAAT